MSVSPRSFLDVFLSGLAVMTLHAAAGFLETKISFFNYDDQFLNWHLGGASWVGFMIVLTVLRHSNEDKNKPLSFTPIPRSEPHRENRKTF
jgi:hypothetical protein